MDETQVLLTSRPLTPDEVKARTKISEDFYSVFSNQVRIAASPTEFRLFFGETYPTATGEIHIIENLSVVLTPMQAKSLAGVLAVIIQRFEAQNGPILMTPKPQLAETPQPAAETPQPAYPHKEQQG
jgi:hypothetical protein